MPRVRASASSPSVTTDCPLLGDHDRGSGVLASGKDPCGRNVGVLQQLEGDEAVVFRGFGVVEDRAELGEVVAAKQMRHVVDRFAREHSDRIALDLQDLSLTDRLGGDPVPLPGTRYSVSSSPELEHRLIVELAHVVVSFPYSRLAIHWPQAPRDASSAPRGLPGRWTRSRARSTSSACAIGC